MAVYERLTEERITHYWNYFIRIYKVSVIPKNKSKLMGFVGWVFQRLGIMKKKDFLRNYHTSLLAGKKRYLFTAAGFDFGKLARPDKAKMLEVLCHELYHLVVQKLGITYLLSKTKVIKAETEAYLCDMELHHFLHGNLLGYDPSSLVRKLQGYNCGERELKYAYAKYAVAKGMVLRGYYMQSIVLKMIRYIEKDLLLSGSDTLRKIKL